MDEPWSEDAINDASHLNLESTIQLAQLSQLRANSGDFWRVGRDNPLRWQERLREAGVVKTYPLFL